MPCGTRKFNSVNKMSVSFICILSSLQIDTFNSYSSISPALSLLTYKRMPCSWSYTGPHMGFPNLWLTEWKISWKKRFLYNIKNISEYTNKYLYRILLFSPCFQMRNPPPEFVKVFFITLYKMPIWTQLS